MTRAKRARIVILGGGFAGLSAAAALPAEWQVSLVDRSRLFDFLPNIHELVSGVKRPRLLQLPRDRIVRRDGHRFVNAAVEGIDLTARKVHLEGRRPLAYDALLVALGGVNATHGVPGAATHGLPFKSVADCSRIARRLQELAEAGGRQPIVIVGGGLEGTEALGEVLRRWRRPQAFTIRWVEAQSRLLSGTPLRLDEHLRGLCKEFDVALFTDSKVAELRPEEVELEDGRILPSAATVWTGGPTAAPLLAESGLADSAGSWAPVDACLQSHVAPEVFALGDVAQLPEALAKQAYHAIDMGRHAARNLSRMLQEKPLEPFRPAAKPTLISFGDVSCFLVAGGHALAGAPLAATKETVFELVMAQLDRRPVQSVVPAVLGRLHQAAWQLAWPALRSPGRWLQQSRVSLLSAR